MNRSDRYMSWGLPDRWPQRERSTKNRDHFSNRLAWNIHALGTARTLPGGGRQCTSPQRGRGTNIPGKRGSSKKIRRSLPAQTARRNYLKRIYTINLYIIQIFCIVYINQKKKNWKHLIFLNLTNIFMIFNYFFIVFFTFI